MTCSSPSRLALASSAFAAADPFTASSLLLLSALASCEYEEMVRCDYTYMYTYIHIYIYAYI